MKRQKPQQEVTLTGYIVPEEWDSNDNVVAIGLTTDEDDYSIELNKMGEELFDFLDEDVEITGFVKEDKDGTKRITVTGYEILPNDDFDEEEEYDEYDYDEESDDDDDDEKRFH